MPLSPHKIRWEIGLEVKDVVPTARVLRDVGGRMRIGFDDQGSRLPPSCRAKVEHREDAIGRYPWRVLLPVEFSDEWQEVDERATFREALTLAKRLARRYARAVRVGAGDISLHAAEWVASDGSAQ